MLSPQGKSLAVSHHRRRNQSLNTHPGTKWPSRPQSYLQDSLPPEQLVTTQWSSGVEEHVDHDVVEVRHRASDPLDDDEDREVAKQGAQEQALGDKLVPERG